MSGVATGPCPSSTAPCQARLSGHQCPLQTVSVGSKGAVKPQKVVEGEEPKGWQHQGSPRQGCIENIKASLWGWLWRAVEVWRGRGTWDGYNQHLSWSTFLGATLWFLKLPGGSENAY